MSKTLDLDNILMPDRMACEISNKYQAWETFRSTKVTEWEEVQRYIFATDTTKTSNSKLPWSNKTTLPKLCQIRDNLYANYMATLFPKQEWMEWEGESEESEGPDKTEAIECYMSWLVDRPMFYGEVSKLVLDYIDYGNCFATVEWKDERVFIDKQKREQAGFAGPMLKRISPLDIVFDPTAPSFIEAPKIIRSIISLGEVKDILLRNSNTPEERADAETLFAYMKDIRSIAQAPKTNLKTKDAIYQISGFTNYQAYLQSNYVEVLTFYGDIYDPINDTFHKNHVIKIVDRHKIISKIPNPSFFGFAPVYHVGWRIRPDNLWAMGPLDNLVGMQYRIDHLENMKADCFDLIAFPPLKIKGYVEDFTWGPMEKIVVGDDGDVEVLSPDVQALNADTQISILEQSMEEMAGSPKEAMGFRTPGEKTKYEFQRLEMAAGRIFQSKVAQFERDLLEHILNAMLELARRKMDRQTIRLFDDEFKIAEFKTLSALDIAGSGRIKPVAARHFAEQANMVQDISNFMSSAVGQDPDVRAHFSSVKLAKMFECLLDLDDYKIVQPYIRIIEQADAQRMLNSVQQQVAMEAKTPAGMLPGDHDPEMETMLMQQPEDNTQDNESISGQSSY